MAYLYRDRRALQVVYTTVGSPMLTNVSICRCTEPKSHKITASRKIRLACSPCSSNPPARTGPVQDPLPARQDRHPRTRRGSGDRCGIPVPDPVEEGARPPHQPARVGLKAERG